MNRILILPFLGLFAAVLGIPVLFGILSVLVMVTLSRRQGTMVHCTAVCSIGLLTNIWGRISPWKVTVNPQCTGCGKCSRACRYGALRPEDLARNRPGMTCTLCGDCIPACLHGHLSYAFPGLSPKTARTMFLVCVLTLHTVFLGVARM